MNMYYKKLSKFGLGILFFALTLSVAGQTKRKASVKRPVKKTAVEEIKPVVEIAPTPEVKKNSRPEAVENQQIPAEKKNEKIKSNVRPTSVVAENQPVYFYEFSKPEFNVSKIYIEHDENGKGKITFQKRDFTDSETDPLQLSAAVLERVKAIWSALNFLDSTENYQTVRDYSHLGTMKFSMQKNGRTRAATFNWTENKDAKALADEYRKIGQQFVWTFDMSVALENQPLDAPRLMDALDLLIRRNEISDAAQMLPLLRKLADDERIPLIARNHSKKLIEKIEKEERKKEDK